MNVAIISDWIIDIGGAESCLKSIYSLYPSSDVYTLVYKEDSVASLGIDKAKVTASFIQRLPWAKRRYRTYLPFFPLAIEQFDLSHYDLVISTSHAVAKGVLTGSGTLHICYCHTPVRYAWDLYHQYLKEAGLTRGPRSWLARLVLHYIRLWDSATANRPDHYIANSNYIARRIKKIYGRDSTVIYPPVDIERFGLHTDKEDFYLTASRMVPYKRMDLIVEAFAGMPDKRLIVVGDGPEFKKIRSKAARNVELLGRQDVDALKGLLQRAKAFVFAAEEDFGIIPVEAQACGTPVIAYGRGGALETVVEFKTGIFFREQSPESLQEAVREFERRQDGFDPEEIRRNAVRFNEERFKGEFRSFVEEKLAARS